MFYLEITNMRFFSWNLLKLKRFISVKGLFYKTNENKMLKHTHKNFLEIKMELHVY